MTDSPDARDRKLPFQFGVGLLSLITSVVASFLAGLKFRPKIDIENTRLLNISSIRMLSLVHETGDQNGTQLISANLGSADGLSAGHHGVIIRENDVIAIVAVIKTESDQCVAQIVRQLIADKVAESGDTVEFIHVE